MNQQQIPEDLQTAVSHFLNSVKANRLNRNLRYMLLGYLNEHQTNLPEYHNDLLFDLQYLFYLLDMVEKEQESVARDLEQAA